MKKFSKVSIVVLTVVFTFGLAGLIMAANTVSLGTADGFAVLAGTGITNTGASTIVGDIGSSAIPTEVGLTACPGGVDCITLTGVNHNDDNPNDATTVSAKAALVTAYDNAAGQSATTNYGPIYDLAPVATTLTPGVYYGASSLGITGKLTLDAQGNPNAVFIFQAKDSTLITETNSEVILINGAQACNVFWQVGSSATLKTGSIFKGNILALTSISLQDSVNVEGRLLARNGAVTLINNTITKATCAPASGGGRGFTYPSEGTITVVKNVINDSGGTKTVADFPLFVSGRLVLSGITNSFSAPTYPYFVTETTNPNYIQTFSGDCDAKGQINLNPSDNKFCVITNDDIGPAVVVPPVPPLIDVVKIPSPLALPAGPGPVTYTYTLRNIGTVPVTNITMVGDTCSPIILASGDTNNDTKLDVNETWVYRCSTTLSQTHTNTVTATGWANDISAVDIASATVVVGAPSVPPLIHVTKVPSSLTLLAGGGIVTYKYTVTNPGTAPLSNVSITDDKCTGLPGRVLGHPGDLNKNNLLESNEAWSFTCQTHLTKTTTNTAIASGEANGLTVRDLAVATVVVAAAAPGLPNSGIAPDEGNIPLNIVVLAGLFAVSIFFYFVQRKQTI